MRRSVGIIGLLWVALAAALFTWHYLKAKREQELLASQAARSIFQQVVVARAWNAIHGGVYVPITEQTQSNPYLDDPQRDVETTDGMKLTKVNPAFMTRQAAEIANRTDGVQVHTTSLNPIRPANRPDAREAEALAQFAAGKVEIAEVIGDGDTRSLFYMAPLMTDASCLRCHAKQGYKVGDVRGGISVRMPLPPAGSIVSLAVGHVLIGGLGLLGIFWFGARLSKAYEILRYQSSSDALTGLPNRRSLLERIVVELGRCRRRKAPLAVILGDIDHFKRYNDTFGHPAGDGCLRWVAQAMQSVLRRPGDFCARYGGEEFVVVLPEVDEAGALFVAERIRSAVEALAIPHSKNAPSRVVTISLGVSVALDGMVPYEDLFRQADMALYEAKGNGRNRVERFSAELESPEHHGAESETEAETP